MIATKPLFWRGDSYESICDLSEDLQTDLGYMLPGCRRAWFRLLLGAVMVALPAISQTWTKRVTGDDSIAIGHFGTLGYIASGVTGRFVGGAKSRSTEDLTLPESLRFLRDSMVATALSMVLMYLTVGLIYLAKAGSGTAFGAFADDSGAGAATGVGNYLMKGVTEGLSFGVAVAVILFGVRTILGELVPAFQGIAERVVATRRSRRRRALLLHRRRRLS